VLAPMSSQRPPTPQPSSAVEKEGKRGHVRGADIFRVRDGRVAEKLSYVKG